MKHDAAFDLAPVDPVGQGLGRLPAPLLAALPDHPAVDHRDQRKRPAHRAGRRLGHHLGARRDIQRPLDFGLAPRSRLLAHPLDVSIDRRHRDLRSPFPRHRRSLLVRAGLRGREAQTIEQFRREHLAREQAQTFARGAEPGARGRVLPVRRDDLHRSGHAAQLNPAASYPDQPLTAEGGEISPSRSISCSNVNFRFAIEKAPSNENRQRLARLPPSSTRKNAKASCF